MAAPPSFLALNARFAGAVQVVRVVNGTTAIPVGGTLAAEAVQTLNNPSASISTCCVKHWRGRLFAVHGGRIYRLGLDGATWVLMKDTDDELAISPIPYADIQQGGLAVCVDANDGLEYLCHFHRCSGVVQAGYTSVDGENWTHVIAVSQNNYNTGRGFTFTYRREIFTYLSGRSIHIWDIAADTYLETILELPAGASVFTTLGTGCAITVFENRLLLFVPWMSLGTLDGYFVHEYDGTNFNKIYTLTIPQGPIAVANGGSAFFQDGDKLYVIVRGRDGGGVREWFCYELTKSGATFTQADITATVIPADWRANGARATADSSVNCMVTKEDNPSSPSVYLFHTNNETISSARTMYPWNGPGSAIGPGVGTISTNYNLPFTGIGDPTNLYQLGDYDASWTQDPIGVPGGFTRKFVAHGDPVFMAHGAVTGTYQIGETITGGTSGATGTLVDTDSTGMNLGGVTGTFVTAEVLTGGTSLATATSSAGPTGGDENHVARIVFNAEESAILLTLPLLSVSGGVASLTSNVISNIKADSVTEYTITTDVVSVSLGEGQQISMGIEVTP